ncbi:MAG: hypothetical protein ACTHNN_09230 [Xanthobacteraceae bacterium]
MAKTDKNLEDTKRLMESLVRMKPKPHEKMKVGKKLATKSAAKRKKQKTGG